MPIKITESFIGYVPPTKGGEVEQCGNSSCFRMSQEWTPEQMLQFKQEMGCGYFCLPYLQLLEKQCEYEE